MTTFLHNDVVTLGDWPSSTTHKKNSVGSQEVYLPGVKYAWQPFRRSVAINRCEDVTFAMTSVLCTVVVLRAYSNGRRRQQPDSELLETGIEPTRL